MGRKKRKWAKWRARQKAVTRNRQVDSLGLNGKKGEKQGCKEKCLPVRGTSNKLKILF